MKRLRDRAVFVSLLPLALATAALGVREATRLRFEEPPAHGRATEFTPPPLFFAAAAAPGVHRRLSVDGEHSAARVVTGDGGDGIGEQGLRAEGTLRILADGTLADVVLDLAPLGGRRATGWPRDVAVHLSGARAQSRTTEVPGVRSARLRCSVTVGGSSSVSSLAVTWLCLPDGTIEMHGVAPLDWAPFDLPEPWWRRMLPRGPRHYALGLDVVLHADA